MLCLISEKSSKLGKRVANSPLFICMLGRKNWEVRSCSFLLFMYKVRAHCESRLGKTERESKTSYSLFIYTMKT